MGFELLVEFEFLDDELYRVENVFAEFFEFVVVVGLFGGVADFVFLDSFLYDDLNSLFFHFEFLVVVLIIALFIIRAFV